MTTPTRRTGLALGALLLAVTMFAGACGGDEAGGSAGPAAGEASAAAALADGAVVIDVRTPEEFADGHIEGAELLDFRSADFAAGVQQLDPEQRYVVYCRSGNRSASARQQMQATGLEVLDGGSLEDMVAAGWPAA